MRAPADDPIIPRLQLVELSLDAVFENLEMLTGKTIIRPAALPGAGTITLQIKRPIPTSEAVRMIETALTANQIAVIPLDDKTLKVVALPQAKNEAPMIISGSTLELPPSGRVAAKLFQLEYLQGSEFFQMLQNLLTPGIGGGIVVFERAGAAFITDTVSNLQRIETLITQLDRPSNLALKPKFYSLKYAKASEVVTRIQGIFQAQKMIQQVGIGQNTSLSSDDRTNQVIIVTDPRITPIFDDVIAKLDVRGESTTRTEVIYLKHATAKDVSQLITNLVQGQNNAAQRSGQQRQGTMPTPAPQSAANTPPQQAQPGRLRLPGDNSAATEFSSMLTVLNDDRTNSVIVNGTLDDIRQIREIVEKVDVVLAQVRIEVMIVEVSLTDSDTTGIDALGLKLDQNRLVGFSTSIGGNTSLGADGSGGLATTTPQSGGNFFGYSLSGMLSIGVTPRKANTHILSQPTLLTTHNKKAKMFVGRSVPTISSYLNDSTSAGTSSSYGGYRSTVSGQKIGITLEITPLIGEDGSVQLQNAISVDDIIDYTTIDGNKQPNVGMRTTESFVTAKSGEVIVLGGLQRSADTRDTNRLGPIPFIGDLLGTRNSKKERTDLIFFLRPVVLTNTPMDNADALRRIDKLPQHDEIKRVLNSSAPETATPAPSTGPVMNRRK
ncbi:MAG: type II secretory pathway, component PulD [Opitutae bacterium]|nr:type II secretory pathway, component PulD [Opitutae bacterium]